MNKINLLTSLAPDIDKVNQAMRQDMQDLASQAQLPEVLLEILEHSLFNGGKRIRPLLCILSARLCGHHGKEIYPLAIASEYLHVATLLHDDVIDNAMTRRGRTTANRIFGLTPAILAGDFLHAHAMFLFGTLGGKLCLELICHATRSMVAGEFLQLANTQNFNLAENDYFEVINGKTALFIGAVCEIGAIFAGAGSRERAALKIYGANLGRAFQIQDDLLDYLGEPGKTGKSQGNDFVEGKMTLPLIHALSTADMAEQNFLLQLLEGSPNERISKLDSARDIISKNDGFGYARNMAESLITDAIKDLDLLRTSENDSFIAKLIGLAQYVIQREK
jgi:octaprenyl-diphosphate synthase